ncbi:hypothetical protein [Xenophilus azovorans]|uniref:hypothetical protein n=1 Tax=Xenophilus azovorans TaxID=151755 RepID=UPI00068FD53A|nr:hypothetical protein [Xenophilus azovorans]
MSHRSSFIAPFLRPAIAAALLAGTAVAMAQSTPPNPASPNPATGAGQQTQQGTSMGTTGVPASPPASGSDTNVAPAPAPAPAPSPQPEMRPPRADRN